MHELMPHKEEINADDPYWVYHKLYSSSEVTAQWPVFAKKIDALRAKKSTPRPAILPGMSGVYCERPLMAGEVVLRAGIQPSLKH
jgi:hypothetical protein